MLDAMTIHQSPNDLHAFLEILDAKRGFEERLHRGEVECGRQRGHFELCLVHAFRILTGTEGDTRLTTLTSVLVRTRSHRTDTQGRRE